MSSREAGTENRTQSIHVRFIVAQRLMKEEMESNDDGGQAIKTKLEEFIEQTYNDETDKWSRSTIWEGWEAPSDPDTLDE